jgi:hypothetical protein
MRAIFSEDGKAVFYRCDSSGTAHSTSAASEFELIGSDVILNLVLKRASNDTHRGSALIAEKHKLKSEEKCPEFHIQG